MTKSHLAKSRQRLNFKISEVTKGEETANGTVLLIMKVPMEKTLTIAMSMMMRTMMEMPLRIMMTATVTFRVKIKVRRGSKGK